MFLQNKTAVGKVKTGPYLIHIQMECLQYVPVNSKTAHPPGKPKHNTSSKGDIIEPTKAIQGKKGGTHNNP